MKKAALECICVVLRGVYLAERVPSLIEPLVENVCEPFKTTDNRFDHHDYARFAEIISSFTDNHSVVACYIRHDVYRILYKTHNYNLTNQAFHGVRQDIYSALVNGLDKVTDVTKADFFARKNAFLSKLMFMFTFAIQNRAELFHDVPQSVMDDAMEGILVEIVELHPFVPKNEKPLIDYFTPEQLQAVAQIRNEATGVLHQYATRVLNWANME